MNADRKDDLKHMEVISVNDVLKQMKCTIDSGEMSLKTTNHKINLHYSDRGRSVSGEIDGAEIKNCNYKAVHRLLDEITDKGRYSIKLINPQSGEWKKINMNNDDLKWTIEYLTSGLIVKTQLLAFTYLCDALFEISKQHIDGKVVNVDKTLKAIAESRGVKPAAVDNSISTALLGNFRNFYDNLKPEYKNDILELWCSTRMFVRNFSHYILNCIYRADFF